FSSALSSWNWTFLVNFVIYIGPINVLLNCFVMFILTRREMRTTYNTVFFLMALDQTVVVGTMTIDMYKGMLYECTPWYYSYFWAYFEIISQCLSQVCRAHATWLAVIIALMRLISIRTQGTSEVCNIRIYCLKVDPPCMPTPFGTLKAHFVWLFCATALLFVIIVNAPNYLAEIIISAPYSALSSTEKPTTVLSVVTANHIYQKQLTCKVFRLSCLLTGTLLNALPCLLLVVLSVTLHTVVQTHCSKQNGERATTLLILIMFSTMITEIPQ
ncbi:hypothetical protein PFISCL1PPCAC_8945, partial [Pristionchus fissidentatus]